MSEPIQLYSKEIDADPFPAYQRLRDEFPCYWSKSAGIWFCPAMRMWPVPRLTGKLIHPSVAI